MKDITNEKNGIRIEETPAAASSKLSDMNRICIALVIATVTFGVAYFAFEFFEKPLNKLDQTYGLAGTSGAVVSAYLFWGALPAALAQFLLGWLIVRARLKIFLAAMLFLLVAESLSVPLIDWLVFSNPTRTANEWFGAVYTYGLVFLVLACPFALVGKVLRDLVRKYS